MRHRRIAISVFSTHSAPDQFQQIMVDEAKGKFLVVHHAVFNTLEENIKAVKRAEANGADLVLLFLSSTPDPKQAAEAIEAGHIDASMLARQMLADPDYAVKVIEGREREIVWCDHANSCLRRLILNVPVACHKNPEMGREDPGAKRSSVVQDAIVWAIGNRTLMTLADKLARMKQK